MDDWRLQPSTSDEYVFCHNELSQQNVIVDPSMLRIRAIIDFEYAGFFPPHFEYPFYQQLGCRVPLTANTTTHIDLLQFLCSKKCR